LRGEFTPIFTNNSCKSHHCLWSEFDADVSQFQYHIIRCLLIHNDAVIIVADPFIAKDSEHTKRLARGALNKGERIWSLLGSYVKVCLTYY
jgi:hypothetical protein